jgi:hypothetical protein
MIVITVFPKSICAITCLIALAACAPLQSPIGPIRIGVKAPQGTVEIKEAVDGLVVGHRLMASGEYELAI